jgi:N-dimethylarginine dimethylaminohydrolase
MHSDVQPWARGSALASPLRSVKTILMCRPTHFEVAYEINPWMRCDDPVDPRRAAAQWDRLRELYESLGYEVRLIDPAPGLPDMVFTANGGLAIDGKVALPRFKHPERQGETAVFQSWFRSQGFETFTPRHTFEGEGDALYAAGTIFAGYGFRSSEESHSELHRFFGKPVVSLRLTDPRFYHLDTAVCPLSDETVIYYPPAFDDDGRRALKRSFAHVIEASEEDAAAFGLNAVSDGERVVLSAGAAGLIETLEERRFQPFGVEMTEFRKSGGAVKCCSLELRWEGA